ncbi:MAG: hypothetical protein QM817_19565 [Archangium sp.]
MLRPLCFSVLLGALCACGVELRDTPGRSCDDDHPCRAPRSCVLGTCRDPVSTGGGDGGTTGGGAGGGSGGGTGFDAGVSDAGVPRWQQKVHGFTGTQTDPGCMLAIDAVRGNSLTATIISTVDNQDTALASVQGAALLPRGLDGRLRGRVTFTDPLSVRGFIPVASVGTQSAAFVRLGFDETGKLRVESDANTVGAAPIVETFSAPSGTFQPGDYLVDVMWRVGVVRQVKLNDVLLGDVNVTGGSMNVPTQITLGPERYDGDGGTAFSITLSTWQLADDLSLVLSDAP